MKRVSGVVITLNEEEKLPTALRSLRPVCDEIVVVDAFSGDRTPKIAREMADSFTQQEWRGYVRQKQAAVDLARGSWILSLDADERLSDELADEIIRWKQTPEGEEAGYRIPRITYFMGRWIKHTTWYPDWQLRLFRKGAGSWVGGRLHESVQLEGPAGRMSEHIEHFTYESVSAFLKQLEHFSTLAAQDLRDRGQQAGLLRLIFHPGVVFFKNYFLYRGFLDGVPGFAVSAMAASSTFFKYLKLYSYTHNPSPEAWKGGTSSSERSKPRCD